MNKKLNQNESDYKDHDLINTNNRRPIKEFKPQFNNENSKLANHYQIQIKAKEPTHERTMSNPTSAEGLLPGAYRLDAHFQTMDQNADVHNSKGANDLVQVYSPPTLVVNSRQYSQNRTASRKNEVQIKSLLKTAFKS